MKKSLALVLVIIMTLVFTACGQKSATPEVTTTVASETTSVTEETTTANTDFAVIDMEALINETSNGKPVVTIVGDNGSDLCSFDFSEMATNKIEVTLDEKVEKGYLYIMMSGNVSAHNLESDGSLFDGVVDIVNGKAEFSVTYDEEKAVNFVVNVPA